MIDLIRSEWIKFRSVRSTVVLVLAAGLLVVIIAGFAANDKRGDQVDGICERTITVEEQGTFTDVRPCAEVVGDPTYEPAQANLGDITVGIPFALFLFGTLGVQIIGQEYRFNTIRPTFTAAPWRLRVLLAKLFVVTTATAAVSLVMIAVCGVIGAVMLDPFTIDGVDQRVVWGTVAFSMGWTMLGMGVGAIIRQPIAAMLILLVEAFVAEQILAGIVNSTAKWMPFLNGIQMTVRDTGDSDMFRSPLAGGIYFFIVATAIWGLGAFLAVKRDA